MNSRRRMGSISRVDDGIKLAKLYGPVTGSTSASVH
jgi:hypothetical protein